MDDLGLNVYKHKVENNQMENIDVYYNSIRKVYDQINNWAEPKPSLSKKVCNWMLGITIVLFLLNLIPIIPMILLTNLNNQGVKIGPLTIDAFNSKNFIWVWISFSLLSLLLLIFAAIAENKTDDPSESEKKPPQTLSPEQVSFIGVYEAYQELKFYFVSHIDQHVENSTAALDKLYYYSINPFFYNRHIPFEDRMVFLNQIEVDDEDCLFCSEPIETNKWLRSNLRNQAFVAGQFIKTFEKYSWFKLEDETKNILSALISFRRKTLHRLMKREDLPTVFIILESLSKFIYAFLPEHKTYMDEKTLEILEQGGMNYLTIFVQNVNNLAYEDARVPKAPLRTSEHSISFYKRMQILFMNNVFFRFITWFIVILILTALVTFMFYLQIKLTPDTMATLIIGSSVMGAATLAIFLPKKPGKEGRGGDT